MNRNSITISKPGAAVQFKTNKIWVLCTQLVPSMAFGNWRKSATQLQRGSFFSNLLGANSFFISSAHLSSFSWHEMGIEWDTALLILTVKILGQSHFSCPALPASKFPVKIKASWCAERSSGNHADERRDSTKPAMPMVQPFWASSEELGWETLQV